jgi:hypothetical protein
MEYDNTDDIATLLAKISTYQENQFLSSSSNNSESQNSNKIKGSTIDEKYFHLKLKKLLCLPTESSFTNVNISLNVFFKDVERFLNWVISKKGITEENASEIMGGIQKDLKGVGKIEFDSFFVNVPGKAIEDFFNNMKQYSFPNCEDKSILRNEKYVVLVESTHCLRSVLPKKEEQMRRYHLFLSVIDKYFKRDDIYLREFHNFFFQKYFLNPNFDLDKVIPKLEKENIFFPISNNYVIIVATDHSFKLFEETIQKIDNTQSSKIIKKSSQKYVSNLIENEKKNYGNENTINEEIKLLNKNEKRKANPIQENYEHFSSILNEINKNENWYAKIMFFDMYYDLITPKCVIEQSLNNINNNTISLKGDVSILQETVRSQEKKMNYLFEFLKMKFKDNDIVSDFDEFVKIRESKENKENAEKK